MQSVFSTYTHGKLLLTGEYAVLDGVTALALPVRYGQRLAVFTADHPQHRMVWQSKNHLGETWFEAEFHLPDLDIIHSTNAEAAMRLQQLLQAARQFQPGFLTQSTAFRVETTLDFPREWGLGTSSTLVAAVAQWADADAYAILDASFGGSGYDVACATADGPILYRRHLPVRAERVSFQPAFATHLTFVYLGQKQDSREGIRAYRERPGAAQRLQQAIEPLTQAVLKADTLAVFQTLMLTHEQLVSEALELVRAQDRYFSDFPGVIKSLGAWGGDFVLAASELDAVAQQRYFQEKGFDTCVPYPEMV